MVLSPNGHKPMMMEMPSPDRPKVLRWSDGPYAGAEVVCRPDPSVSHYLDHMEVAMAYRDRIVDALEHGIPMPKLEQDLRYFCDWRLISWNLTRAVYDADGKRMVDGDGQPVQEPIPVTYEGAISLPLQFVQQMLAKAEEEEELVSGPLSTESSSLPPSPEPSEVTEPSSDVRRNSLKRSPSNN